MALKIRSALADDNVSVSEIARLLGTDPALAARTLRIANSAMFYRGSRPITSLNGAVSQLGHKMVRNVALSFAAQQVFIGYGSRALRDLVGAVWRHSVHVAVVSHMLARVRTKLNADEAFLAGLAARGRQALHPDAGEGRRGGARERRRLQVRAGGLASARRVAP